MAPTAHGRPVYGLTVAMLLVFGVPQAGHAAEGATPAPPTPMVQVDASAFPRIAVFLSSAPEASPGPGGATIYEDGRPQSLLPPERRLPPLGLLVLVDIRPDHAEWLPAVDALLRWLSDRLSPQDYVATLTPAAFGIDRFPFRRARGLLQEVAQVGPPGEGRLYDAMAAGWIACRRHTGRAAILVLTTGPDRGSHVRDAELGALTGQGQFPMFAAALGNDESTAALLSGLATGSGGAAAAVDDPTQLLSIMVPLLERLFTASAVWYRTTDESRDGGWRSVAMDPSGDAASGAPVRGYFAPASPDLCRPVDLQITGERDRMLHVPYTLTSADGRVQTASYTGEAVLVYPDPGAYQVRLLTGPTPGAPSSILVSASRDTQTTLVARMAEFILWGPPEAAGLHYTVDDERTDGEVASGLVVRRGDGVGEPQRVYLLPGRYHVFVEGVPLSGIGRVDVDLRQVVAEAGALVEMDLSARGVLLVSLRNCDPAPDFAVYPHLPGEESHVLESAVAHGTINTPLDLPVGIYDVVVQTKPPTVLGPIEVSEGEVVTNDLPELGEVEVRLTDTAGASANVSWFAEQEGAFVFAGMTNAVVLVVPGVYALTIDTQPRQRRSDCVIESGGRYVEDLGQLAGLAVVLRGLSDESVIRRKFVLVDPSTTPVNPDTGMRDPRGGVRIANGLTGGFPDVCLFIPDTYDLIVWTSPQTVLPGITLVEGQVRTIDVGRLAGLMVDTGGEVPLRFVVRRAEDSEVAGTYDAGTVALVQPGTYKLDVVEGSGVALREPVPVEGLTEAGVLFVDPGDPGDVEGLSFALSRADTGEALGTHPAATRVELPEGEYMLVPSVPEVRLPHTVRVAKGVTTVVPRLNAPPEPGQR